MYNHVVCVGSRVRKAETPRTQHDYTCVKIYGYQGFPELGRCAGAGSRLFVCAYMVRTLWVPLKRITVQPVRGTTVHAYARPEKSMTKK